MSSPWDPAVPQAMQRHGGSNRSVPKVSQSKSAPKAPVAGLPAPEMQGQDDADVPVKPDRG
ncbi:MAG: hypothetical protein NTV56_10860 [Alphaproteobacteria bacterium]|nr:hypothetical protein [Alphaproteobacteria bacterium]